MGKAEKIGRRPVQDLEKGDEHTGRDEQDGDYTDDESEAEEQSKVCV
jgi:hypothetical protein